MTAADRPSRVPARGAGDRVARAPIEKLLDADEAPARQPGRDEPVAVPAAARAARR